MEKAKIIDFSLKLNVEFECPHCGHAGKLENSSASPYSAVSDDPTDVMCENCEEFITIEI